MKPLKANSVVFFLPTIWWVDALKRIEKIIRDNASEQKKKKPRLKFNPELALTGLRTTRDRRLHQFRRPKFEFDSARMKYSVCTGPKDRFFSLSVWWYRGAPFDGWRCCVVQQTTFSSQTQHHGSPGLCMKEFNFLVFLRIYPRGPCLVICYFFKKWKRFSLCINWISKIMVQFCYLRLCTVNLFPVVCCKGWQE